MCRTWWYGSKKCRSRLSSLARIMSRTGNIDWRSRAGSIGCGKRRMRFSANFTQIIQTATDQNVGGRLPPIAVLQSPEAVTDTLQSGASPLPHLTEPDLENVKSPPPITRWRAFLWPRGLDRAALTQQFQHLLDAAFQRQGLGVDHQIGI